MTNEEVVKWLEWAEMVYKNAYKGTTGGGEIHEAMQTAIEALEKQIPKKPTRVQQTRHFHCPMCDAGLRHYNNPTPYCRNCGQAIDWESDNQ